MAGVGVGGFPLQRKFSLPWCPGCARSSREQPDSSGKANGLWQLIHCRRSCPPTLLGSLWPGFPTPCLPNTARRAGEGGAGEAVASPSLPSLSFLRSEPLGSEIGAVSPERFCWKSRHLSLRLLRDLVQRGTSATFVFVLFFSLKKTKKN